MEYFVFGVVFGVVFGIAILGVKSVLELSKQTRS